MIREKYVEEHFPRWMKWGGWINPGDNGDVNDGQQDIVTSVTPEVADKLIKARDEFVDKLIAIFTEHPDQFNVYGPPVK